MTQGRCKHRKGDGRKRRNVNNRIHRRLAVNRLGTSSFHSGKSVPPQSFRCNCSYVVAQERRNRHTLPPPAKRIELSARFLQLFERSQFRSQFDQDFVQRPNVIVMPIETDIERRPWAGVFDWTCVTMALSRNPLSASVSGLGDGGRVAPHAHEKLSKLGIDMLVATIHEDTRRPG